MKRITRHTSEMAAAALVGAASCADHSREYPDACISVNASASEPTDRGKPIRAPGRPILLDRLPVD
jgi:hypothetical protein